MMHIIDVDDRVAKNRRGDRQTGLEPAWPDSEGDDALAFELPSFRAALGLRNPALMTIAASFPRLLLGAFARLASDEYFEVAPGTHLLGRANRQERASAHPTVVLLHGLTGNAERGYMLGAAAKLHALGFNVLRLNARNCGGTEAFSQTFYNAAQSDDVAAVLEAVGQRFGSQRSYLLGFSLGGSIALRMAGTHAERPPGGLSGLVAISAPLDLELSARRLEVGRLNRRVTKRFLQSFGELLEARAAHHGPAPGGEAVARAQTLWEFDHLVTAPEGGFDSVEAYYRSASPITHLERVAVPGLLLHALDDPLVASEPYADPRVAAHPTLRVELAGQGGHVGFLGGSRALGPRGRDPDRRWAENRAVDYLAHLERAAGGRIGAPIVP